MKKLLIFIMVLSGCIGCCLFEPEDKHVNITTGEYIGYYQSSSVVTHIELFGDKFSTFNVTGRVKNQETKEGIPSARFIMYSSYTEPMSVMTDETGNFSMEYPYLDNDGLKDFYLAFVTEKDGAIDQPLIFFEKDVDLWTKCGIMNPDTRTAACGQAIKLSRDNIGPQIRSDVFLTMDK